MRSNNRTPASAVALGGVLAALAVVIMALGTLIPVATYVCPVICCLLCRCVDRLCGKRMAWAWYGAVTILSLLLAPDKEAAFIFLALGYYPIVKSKLDRLKGNWLWKLLYFNAVILLTYWLLMHLLGFDQLTAEFSDMGLVMTALLLILGNVTFFLLDKLLERKFIRRK